jgi:hypothetical protein
MQEAPYLRHRLSPKTALPKNPFEFGLKEIIAILLPDDLGAALAESGAE